MNSLINYKIKIHSFIEYLIILIPLLLITGPFLSDLSLSIVSIYFLFKYRKEDRDDILKTFIYLFLIFYFIILISSFTGEDKYLSLKNSTFYFRFLLFSLCFFYILKNNNNILTKLFYFLIICFLGLFFDAIYQFYFKENIFGWPINKEYHESRVSSFFGDELILGSYLARFSPILFGIYFFQFSKKKYSEIFLIVFIILSEAVIFLSGERTAFLLFNFYLILMFIFLNDFKILKLKIFSALLIFLIFLFSTDIPSKKRIIDDTLLDLQSDDYNSKFVIINRQYNEHFISAYKIFIDNKTFGVGPKNFRIVCHEEKYNFSDLTCSTHPHNTYLQLLAETGIFSFLIILFTFLLILFFLIKSFYIKIFKKEKYFNNLEICLLLHLFISLFPFSPTGSFFNNWISIIYYYPVGILIWSLSKKSMRI